MIEERIKIIECR